MILLIDNYDSFTWNLVHLIGAKGYEVRTIRNDAISAQEAIKLEPEAIVLSPGPCTPDQAGICLELVNSCAAHHVPLFGVCLGLQSMAQAFGGKIIRANKLMHGKVSTITHNGSGFLKPLPRSFIATRYHSLVAEEASLPSSFTITARSDDDQEIMAIEHQNKPIAAVQFHPESIASDHGGALFSGFMKWSMEQRARHAPN